MSFVLYSENCSIVSLVKFSVDLLYISIEVYKNVELSYYLYMMIKITILQENNLTNRKQAKYSNVILCKLKYCAIVSNIDYFHRVLKFVYFTVCLITLLNTKCFHQLEQFADFYVHAT